MFIIGRQDTPGRLMLASQPVSHIDYITAVTEAERLARIHTTGKFVVFQAVSLSEAQPIPVKTVSFN